MPEAAPLTGPSAQSAPGVGAAVAGLGVALPEKVVDNAPIAARLGIDEEWIVSRTGVRERRIAEPGERVSEYAARAARAALASAMLDPGELDLILVATMTHERFTPSASALVAAEIGAGAAGAIDVGAACSGFISALGLAAAQIEAGRAGTVAVIGADLLSTITNRDDRSTAGLFGDAAGAVVLTAVPAPGRVGPVLLGADGARAELVTASHADPLLRMKGPDLFRQAVDRLCEATEGALEAAGLSREAIDLFVYHQANSRIIAAVGERLELPAERVVDCVPRYGNTSAATIPLALEEAYGEGRLGVGDTLLLAAFGGGLTWASCTLEWGLGDAA